MGGQARPVGEFVGGVVVDVLVVVAACVAGGLGAALRYVLDTLAQRLLPGGYPWGVFVVNVLGSFTAGVVLRVAAGLTGGASETVTTVVVLGLLGGFTTFSTSVVQTVRLGAERGGGEAVAHAAGTWVACVSAAALGLALVG